MQNRHPIDELADIRAEVKRLKDREAELRTMVLDGACGLTGDQFDADVVSSESERLDAKALRHELGAERLRPFLKRTTTQTIRLSERVLPDEL